MNGIEERIAEVLRKHPRRIDPNHPAWPNCRCGFDCEDGDWAPHVASVLVAELGLTEEWSDDIAGPNWGRHRRYVTKTVFFKGSAQL